MGFNYLHSDPNLKNLRREMRNNPTDEEYLLWQNLKGKKLEGRKFRRQHSVGRYILDFYCHSERLAIELDGAHHFTDEGKESDRIRDEFLNSEGIKVLRIPNSKVTGAMNEVLKRIINQFGTEK